MAVDIVMPQMGESIFEGTITKWLKKPGDKVERDEPLFEISTDKVDAEIPSPSAGVLKEIKVAEGKTVPIQTVVGVIDAVGSASAAAPAPAAPAPAASAKTEAPAKAAAPAQPSPANGKAPAAPATARPAAQPTAAAPSSPAPATGAGKEGARIHSSPLVKRMAKEHGIDLSGVSGTGAGGRISKQDIEAIISGGGQAAGRGAEPADETHEAETEMEEAFDGTPAAPATARQTSYAPPARPAQAPPPSAPSQGTAQHGGQVHAVFEAAVPREKIYFGDYEVSPMTVMRQRIGEHMVASKRVSAHVYSVDEIDMSKVAALRAKSKDEF
jgi:2-oxoglutarate dehydrogenase E2 component (dihydrolipoamide succinyltransferase)